MDAGQGRGNVRLCLLNTVLHKGHTRGEDQSIMIVDFESGVTDLAGDSWARHGGMNDKVEVYGTEGVTYADLFMGNSALTYSLRGYGYAAEKAGPYSRLDLQYV